MEQRPTAPGGTSTGATRSAPLTAAGAHRRRDLRRCRLGLLAVALLAVASLLGIACGGTASAGGSSSSGSSSKLMVFAAASLTDAFNKLGAEFEAAHPGVHVVFDFDGSQNLVAQMQQGAPADVFAAADTITMHDVSQLVGPARTFATNKLQIAVAPGNPKHIHALADLAAPDLKVVLAAPQVPAGEYAEQALKKAGVTLSPVSLEENVKGVVTKVSLGEADAGIVYVTDVTAAHGAVQGVTIPSTYNVMASYPIATVDSSKNLSYARAFVDLVLSAQGQKVLRSFGFLPPPTP